MSEANQNERRVIQQAMKFAATAHEGQTYGPNEPYTAHLEAVAIIVAGDEVAEVVAWLHDVVEDTPITLRDVETHFGLHVAECVALLTDESGVNRKERKAKSHAKLAKVQPQHYTALKVKVADRVANAEACVAKGNIGLLSMYRREQEAFKAAAYRPGLCDDLWNRIEAGALPVFDGFHTLRHHPLKKRWTFSSASPKVHWGPWRKRDDTTFAGTTCILRTARFG